MLLMKDNHITPAQVKVSSSPSYTLADLTQLARDWRDEMHLKNLGENGDEDDVSIPLVLSVFLRWLAKKEKEASDATSGMS